MDLLPGQPIDLRLCFSGAVDLGELFWLAVQCGLVLALDSGSLECACISQKIFIRLFHISQFPQKSVNVSFIITNVKNKLTNLCGNLPSQNDFEITFWVIRLAPFPRGSPAKPPVCGLSVSL